MKAFADASFFLALVVEDVHSHTSRTWTKNTNVPVLCSPLAYFEAENRLHRFALQGSLMAAERDHALRELDRLQRAGSIILAKADTRALATEARRLLAHFSPDTPHGTLDVLHVAAARLARATDFLTFDKNQRVLAVAAGLACPVA